MNKKSIKIKQKINQEKELSPFQKRMDYEDDFILSFNGKPSMSREEALRILGFEEDKK
jgi:hypothetical protein